MTWERAGEMAKPVLKCPLCGGQQFDEQKGRMDSRWGITSHKLVLRICRNCGLVLQFSAGAGSSTSTEPGGPAHGRGPSRTPVKGGPARAGLGTPVARPWRTGRRPVNAAARRAGGASRLMASSGTMAEDVRDMAGPGDVVRAFDGPTIVPELGGGQAMTAFKLRRYLRMCTFALELVVAVPLSLPFIALGWLAILVDRFAETSLVISHIPFYLGEHVRYFYYRATLRKVGRRVTFKYGSFCQYRDASIGNRVVIGYYNALGMVSIGDDVSIGGFVNMTSGRHQHAIDDPTLRINQQPGRAEVIHIGSDVWIGSNCVISANIGNRCVIGSGSTVVKDVPDHTIYGGNPARLIRALD